MSSARKASQTAMLEQNNQHNEKLESRVGHLEGAVEGLKSEVQSISIGMQEIIKGFTSFKETVLAKIGVMGAPKWPLIFGISTLILTVLGLGSTIITIIFSGQSNALSDMHDNIVEINRQFYEQRFTSGEAKAMSELQAKELVILKDEILNLRAWRLRHVEETAYECGRIAEKVQLHNNTNK